jgi:hypothetical protein
MTDIRDAYEKAQYLLAKDFDVEEVHAVANALKALVEAVYYEPCHVTGMHTPSHHLRGTYCDHMQAAIGKRITTLVFGEENGDVPRRLHERCYHCREFPSRGAAAELPVGWSSGPG